MKCDCCDEIEFWSNQTHECVDFKCFVKIVQFTFEKGKRKIPRNNRGSVTTKAYQLNYCPKCGKKI